MFTSAVAVTNEKDIMAIHGVVSNELKAQIEKAYPHLFRDVFDFTHTKDFLDQLNLPFLVGLGLVDEKDRYKCLVVNLGYEVELDETSHGRQIIRFVESEC